MLQFDYILPVPNTLVFLDVKELVSLQFISKKCSGILINDCQGYWQAFSSSLAKTNGLYLSRPFLSSKKYFFDELWVYRMKWNAESSINMNFKIGIVSRFRPGKRQDSQIALPLHQFLKVKRHNKTDDENRLLIGESDPEEFLDPFMKTLMRDPVKLLSSGQIVDRSTAVHCILRNRKDPFNNKLLTNEMLEPCEELAKEILQWRLKKFQSDNISVGVKEVKGLLDESAIDPILLQALMDAERLTRIGDRTSFEASQIRIAEDGSQIIGGEHVDGVSAAIHDEILPLPPNFNLNGPPVLGDKSEFSKDGEEIMKSPFTTTTTTASENQENEENDIGTSRWARFHRTTEAFPKLLDVNQEQSSVSMNCPGAGLKTFHYSDVYDEFASQKDVYEGSVKDQVAAVLNGINCCLLCYGQTGSGKTHTMFGPEGNLDDYSDRLRTHRQHRLQQQQALSLSGSSDSDDAMDYLPESAGVVIRACEELLEGAVSLSAMGIVTSITAQFVEIYNDQVVDLLSGRESEVRRLTGEIVGAEEVTLQDPLEVLDLLRKGHARKRFAATAMNDRSSRSHTILVLGVSQTRRSTSEGAKDLVIRSELHLVDLAGSERIKRSKVTGANLTEATGINQSLLVLGKVVAALVEARSHVPYLESRLTTLLRRAFGGCSRTSLVVCCRSDDEHGEETLQSLRFGERCGMISTNVITKAGSLSSALEAVDEALDRVSRQLQVLEAKGKQSLPSYVSLKASYGDMQRRRLELSKKQVMV